MPDFLTRFLTKTLLSVLTVGLPPAVPALQGCQSNPRGKQDLVQKPIPVIEIPDTVLTYEGSIPCASCEQIDIVLQLRPNAAFAETLTYVGADSGRDVAHDDRGSRIQTDGVLILNGTSGPSSQWVFRNIDIFEMPHYSLTA